MRCIGLHGAALDRLPYCNRSLGIVGQLAGRGFKQGWCEAPLLQDSPTTGRQTGSVARGFRTPEVRHRGNKRRVAHPGNDLAAGARRQQDREESQMSKSPHCGARLAALRRAVKQG
jgi:hypothetical protein